MSTKNQRSFLHPRFILKSHFLFLPFCIGLLLTNFVYAKDSYSVAGNVALIQAASTETDAANSLASICRLIAVQDIQQLFPEVRHQVDDNYKEDLIQHEPSSTEPQLYVCTSEWITRDLFQHIQIFEEYQIAGMPAIYGVVADGTIVVFSEAFITHPYVEYATDHISDVYDIYRIEQYVESVR